MPSAIPSTRPATRRPSRLAALLLAMVLALLVAACGPAGDSASGPADVDPGTPTPADDTGDATGDDTGEDAGQETGEDARPPGRQTFTGTLGGSDVEGGCVWLDADDGTRYELIAGPDAEVAIDPGNRVVVSLQGEPIAAEGDEITVEGVVDPGMVTFCQVGTNLVVSDVRGS